MDFIVFGLNHKTAPIHIRERLALKEEDQPHFAHQTRDFGCEEALLLSTCNRVELYGTTQLDSLDQKHLKKHLLHLLAKESGIHFDDLEPHVYFHQNQAAFRHLFRVASSLDSMVVGEPQILGQLKSAFERCKDAHTTGRHLNQYLERAFTVAKRVRNQTGIGRTVVSISSVAVNLARHIFDDLSQRTVLLIGAGAMGELAAHHLKQEGVSQLLVANRSFEKAVSLANKLQGTPRRLDELDLLLVQADIIITSTAARNYIITPDHVQKAIKARKYRPLFLIDIAVPRNVDPTTNEIENAYVYDVDDLNQIAEENRAHRKKEAETAETLVYNEVSQFQIELQNQSQIKPTIVALKNHVDTLKQQELAWARKKLRDLDEDEFRWVEQMGHRFANKVLHSLYRSLKKADPQQAQVLMKSVHQLFPLEEQLTDLDLQLTPLPLSSTNPHSTEIHSTSNGKDMT